MGDGLEDLGAVVTGGLIAGAIDQGGTGHGGAAAGSHAAGHGACANCGAALAGPHCSRCGQAAHLHNNVAGLLHDIAHGVFHFEGRTWHTLPLLATKPGHLTRRYIDGERVKFVSPMALFLFSVFLMFALVSNMAEVGGIASPGVMANAENQLAKAQRLNDKELTDLTAARAAATSDAARMAIDSRIESVRQDAQVVGRIGQGVRTATSSRPDEFGKTGFKADTRIPWLNRAIDHASENPALLLYKIKTSAYKYSWALIPISLPFIWLLFAFRRDVGFYDHAIFATYSLAFMSLLVVVLMILKWIGVSTGVLVLAAMLIPPVHMYKQLKYGYGLTRWGAGWRTFALLNMTGIASALFVGLLFYLGTAH